jgi:hypothetical protein
MTSIHLEEETGQEIVFEVSLDSMTNSELNIGRLYYMLNEV